MSTERTYPAKPREVTPGQTIRLDHLDDALQVVTEDHVVASVALVHAGRYLVTTEDGGRHHVGARQTLQVVAK